MWWLRLRMQEYVPDRKNLDRWNRWGSLRFLPLFLTRFAYFRVLIVHLHRTTESKRSQGYARYHLVSLGSRYGTQDAVCDLSPPLGEIPSFMEHLWQQCVSTGRCEVKQRKDGRMKSGAYPLGVSEVDKVKLGDHSNPNPHHHPSNRISRFVIGGVRVKRT